MTDDRWTAAAERFVRRLERGAFADAAREVSPAVPAGAMSAERLGELWTQLTAQLGPLAALEPRRVEEQEGRHVVDLGARFARSEHTLRILLTPEEQVVGFWLDAPRPPAYVPPSYVDTASFEEVDVTVGSGAFALGGTLTLPKGDAPVPVVVLVHGSGPNDRDETIGANRPFRDLAWGLATRGIGVLRYDKRTYAHRGKLGADVTVEQEVVDDALAALALARAHRRAAPDRVYLLGHSLGATLAPEIARRDAALAGVVLLAASARPPADVVLEQIAYLRALAPESAAAYEAVVPRLEQVRAGAAPPDAIVLGAPARYWYDLAARSPTEEARALTVPILALQGGRDYQVTDADFDLWRRALAGRRGATLELYPELNHLFMAGAGRATPAEYTGRSGHVAPRVIDDVARFITSPHAP